jgi:hypothetical protein
VKEGVQRALMCVLETAGSARLTSPPVHRLFFQFQSIMSIVGGQRWMGLEFHSANSFDPTQSRHYGDCEPSRFCSPLGDKPG